jgi:hypothetical protein
MSEAVPLQTPTHTPQESVNLTKGLTPSRITMAFGEYVPGLAPGGFKGWGSQLEIGYKGSITESVNGILVSMENHGTGATVAVVGQGVGAHAFGGNFVGYCAGENNTAIGIEIDFGHLTRATEGGPEELGAISYGLDVVFFPHELSRINQGSFLQFSAKHNSAGPNLGCKHGIIWIGAVGAQPVSSTEGSLFSTPGIEAHLGIDLSEGTFGEAALKFGEGARMRTSTAGHGLSIGASTAERLTVQALNGLSPAHGQGGFYAAPGGNTSNTTLVMVKEALYLNRFFTDRVYPLESLCWIVSGATALEADLMGFAIYEWEPIAEKLMRRWQLAPVHALTNTTGIYGIEVNYELEPLTTYYFGSLAVPAVTGPTTISWSMGTSGAKQFWPGITGERKGLTAAGVKAPWAEMFSITGQTTFPLELAAEQSGSINNPVIAYRTFK